MTTLAAARVGALGWPITSSPTGRNSAAGRRLDPATLAGHIDQLYRTARALCGSREEAEDLVQETFARVLQRPRFVHSEDDLGYLLRVLRNTFISGCRRARCRPQLSEAPAEVTSMEDVCAAQPEVRLERAALYQAIKALPVPFRDALVAVDMMGLSYGEASQALRVKQATLTTRLHRARQRVAAALVQEPSMIPAVRHAPLEVPVETAA